MAMLSTRAWSSRERYAHHAAASYLARRFTSRPPVYAQILEAKKKYEAPTKYIAPKPSINSTCAPASTQLGMQSRTQGRRQPLTITDLLSIFWTRGLSAAAKAIRGETEYIKSGRHLMTREEVEKLDNDIIAIENEYNIELAKLRRRIVTDFSKMPEVSNSFEAERLRECIKHLKPYINEKHLIEFTTHVYNSERTGAQAVLTKAGIVMVQFHSKIIRDCNNECQLAFIAGHEIAHLIARHAEKRRYLPYTSLEAEEMRIQHELDADKIGMFMMAKAGYDPKGAIELLQRMERSAAANPRKSPPQPPGERTHPPISERIARLQELLEEAYSELKENGGFRRYPLAIEKARAMARATALAREKELAARKLEAKNQSAADLARNQPLLASTSTKATRTARIPFPLPPAWLKLEPKVKS